MVGSIHNHHMSSSRPSKCRSHSRIWFVHVSTYMVLPSLSRFINQPPSPSKFLPLFIYLSKSYRSDSFQIQFRSGEPWTIVIYKHVTRIISDIECRRDPSPNPEAQVLEQRRSIVSVRCRYSFEDDLDTNRTESQPWPPRHRTRHLRLRVRDSRNRNGL